MADKIELQCTGLSFSDSHVPSVGPIMVGGRIVPLSQPVRVTKWVENNSVDIRCRYAYRREGREGIFCSAVLSYKPNVLDNHCKHER